MLLAVGGAVAQRRRLEGTRRQFEARLEQANRDLAAARAEDRGWDEARLEEAARRAFAERRPGAAADRVFLVQVVDRPGTDEDRAVFRIESGGEEHEVELSRRGDEWLPARP